MKQRKQNESKDLKRGILLTLLLTVLCLTNTGTLLAQPNVYATNPDLLLLYNNGLPNSAMIDYSPNCSSCGTAQLTATVYSSSGTAGLTVDDGVNTPISISIPQSELPDVVIGNNTTTSSDYLVGVVYSRTIGSATDIYLDIYDVVQPGTSSFAINYVNTTQITTSGTAAYDPRIDIIAKYDNPFLGLPLCDNFVIEYAEGSPLAVHGYYASLNNPAGGTYSYPVGYNPAAADVAAIQRVNYSGTNDDIALFAFSTPKGLEYREWDITQGTYSPLILLDGTGSPFVRIDAIDDYNINDPSALNPLAVWCIAQSKAATDVTIYNNLLGFGGTNISTGAYNNQFLSITAGPCAQYTVAYCALDGNDDIIAQNIDWSTGLLSNANRYQVNYAPVAPARPTIAATCNASGPSYAQNFVTCWNRTNGGLYYKYSTCGMAFKPGAITNANTSIHWKLSPNPAIDHIMLSTSAGTLQNYHYTITDVVGKVVQTADLTKADQQINISSLSTGLFLINIYEHNNKVKTIKFTKD